MLILASALLGIVLLTTLYFLAREAPHLTAVAMLVICLVYAIAWNWRAWFP